MADSRRTGSAGIGPVAMVVDLAVVVLLTVGTLLAVAAPGTVPETVRIAMGLGFVALAPGYAFVAALFPERPTQTRLAYRSDDPEWRSRLHVGERLLLGVAMNVFVVPFAGLLLNYTAIGITPSAVVNLLGGFTLITTVVAWSRRARRSPDERFGVPLGEWLDGVRSWFRTADSRGEFVLDVLLVVAILTATSTVVFAAAAPGQGETFTEFYVGTENETTGTVVANDYPTQFERGQSQSMAVGITNEEHRSVNYTVIVELQEVAYQNGTATVTGTTRVTAYRTRLEHGASTWKTIDVQPETAGENRRLTFLLYRGEPPVDPAVENAYRHLHVWIDVSEANGSSGDTPTSVDQTIVPTTETTVQITDA